MGNEIKAANAHVIKIFNKLKEKYKDYKFQFGAVFYRDQIDSKTDKNEYFPLTDDMNELKNNISKIEPYGGKDIPEDWVVGYKIALNDIKWRNGIKLIIHIADAGAHGVEYSKNDKYPDEGPKLTEYIQECAKKNINIIGFKIGEEPGQSFEKMSEIYNKYKIEQKDDGQFMEIYDFNRGENKEEEEEVVSKNFLGLVLEAADQVINPSFKYLKKLKQILDLKNDLINDEGDKKSLLKILDQDNINYVITEDNYKKMVLLFFRIKANVPVIIMGETGCGKTSLIIKLSQLLNNGENVVQIINIHPGITEEEICKSMIAINKKAKEQEFIDEEKTQKKELWAFFDEINTSLSLSLLTEIFINRTFDGEKLEDNIRLIGACNPYRRRKLTAERCGLTREDDKDDDLVYKVEQLPQSLLYYVFSFGSIKKEDEKKINSRKMRINERR
jgi:energy-coupling factor transporter ATP-binding protein EcfA2